MIKYFFLALLCISVKPKANAQLIINGIIKDSVTNLPIYGATISLSKNDKVLSYTISDGYGNFIIKMESFIENLNLNFTHIGYAKKIISFDKNKKELQISLISQKILLPDVIVSAQPITKQGDTITYKVDKFLNKNDRVIGDLIKRLPGIIVAPNGLITYNGKAISNCYIEGLDLLEGKYNLANNNITVDAVDKVQVLENNQPIKILDSNSTATSPALNIKLKKNAINKLYKNVEITTGIDTTFLLGFNSSIMKFAKNNQFLGGVRLNNYGENYSNDIENHYTIDNLDAIKYNTREEPFLNLTKPHIPLLKNVFNTFSKTNFTYFNGLKLLSPTRQVKYSLDFYNNNQTDFYNKLTIYKIPNNNINIVENQITNCIEKIIRANVKYTINKATLYVSNKFDFYLASKNDTNSIEGFFKINQNLESRNINLFNDLMFYKKKNATFFQLNSYTSFNSTPSNLIIKPGIYIDLYNNSIPYEKLNQNARTNKLNLSNTLSFKKNFWGLTNKYLLSLNYEYYSLTSFGNTYSNNINKPFTDSFKNMLKSNMIFTEFSNSVAYNKKRLKMSAILPIVLGKVFVTNINLLNKNSFAFFNPTLHINYKVSQFFDFNLVTSVENEIEQISTNAIGIIATSYRNVLSGENLIPKNKSKSISIALNYRDIKKAIFGYINGYITSSTSNINLTQQFIGLTQINKYIPFNNNLNTFFINSNISKYYTDIKLSTSINTSVTYNNMQILINEKKSKVRNQITAVGLSINTRAIKNMFNDNSTQLNSVNTKIQGQSSTIPFYQINSKLTLSKNFKKVFSIKGVVNYFNNKSTINKNWIFVDAVVHFKFTKSDFRIHSNNLINYKNFVWADVSENSFIQNEIRLRGRNFLISYLFKL